ncbi:sigma-70 family RNA polymerase sigma factor [Amycolatopsis thermoflava]|uniref:sigma-70 family RNA polymerase sigma factor n=1 Tax=Amycolatopsis thermoflava TaxID=84480 RepID=UPI00365D80A4
MDLSLSENEPKNPVFFVRRKPVAAEHENVFDLAWRSFEWLVTGPDPVAVDGRDIDGLPRRLLPLDELGTALLARSCAQTTRDAAWRYLVTRSRAEGGTWTVACAGLALPVLLPVARSLTREFAGDRDDVYSAILTGFLDGLREVDLDRPAILVRLRWTAYRAGARTVREALDRPRPREDLGFRSAPPERPGSHPDLVLAAAVEAGAISAAEASLISATRLGELSLAEAAQARGQTYEAAKRARLRAEARLRAHLATDDDNDNDNDNDNDSRMHRARRRGARSRVSRKDAKSGVSRRGSHAPADRAHPPRRTDTRSDVRTTRKVR